MTQNHILLLVLFWFLSVVFFFPHPLASTSLPRSVSPFFSLWALSSDGFWPTFGCRELQCVWAKSQHGFTGRASKRWRDRESERQRMSEKNHVKWDRDLALCCQYTLAVSISLCQLLWLAFFTDLIMYTAFCTDFVFQ